VRKTPDVDALAVRSDRAISVLVWNYHDDDVAAPGAEIQLRVEGIPPAAKRLLLRHYRVDSAHSNAYALWKRMGSPQKPTPEQYSALEAAGQLEQLTSPRWIASAGGKTQIDFTLPRQGVSLIQLAW
ncbi:MAG: GH39 family glycosyl hydrolase, partial [bacterium]